MPEPPPREPKARPAPKSKAAGDPLAEIEAQIEQLEREIAELEVKLAADWTDADTIAAHAQAREKLQPLLGRWETLLEEVAGP